jgi:hypothetical protein
MRYLLDELMAYEEGFSDIMMKNRASERHETFMGEHNSSATISKGDLQVFEEKLISQVRTLLTPTRSGGEATTRVNRNSGQSQLVIWC